MTAVAFDTLKLARRLEAAGFASKQAADTAEALADAIGDQVATKSGLAEIRTDMKELELRLKFEIASAKNDTLRWLVPLILAQIAVMIGLLLKLV